MAKTTLTASFCIANGRKKLYTAITAILVGQIFGAKEKDTLREAIQTIIAFSLLLCVAFTVIGYPLSNPILKLLKTPGDVFPFASMYLHITKPGFSEELMAKIRDIHIDANTIPDGLIFVSGVTIGTNVCLTILQCSRNDCFMDSLQKVLHRREITYKLYPFDLPPARAYLQGTER